jgi:hypothetical protein
MLFRFIVEPDEKSIYCIHLHQAQQDIKYMNNMQSCSYTAHPINLTFHTSGLLGIATNPKACVLKTWLHRLLICHCSRLVMMRVSRVFKKFTWAIMLT